MCETRNAYNAAPGFLLSLHSRKSHMVMIFSIMDFALVPAQYVLLLIIEDE